MVGEPFIPSSALQIQPDIMWQKEDEEKSYCQRDGHKLTAPRNALCFLIQQSMQFYKEQLQHCITPSGAKNC